MLTVINAAYIPNAGWRHALWSEWPFIITIITFPIDSSFIYRMRTCLPAHTLIVTYKVASLVLRCLDPGFTVLALGPGFRPIIIIIKLADQF